MKIIQQPDQLTRVSLPEKTVISRHSKLFPPSLRCIISGPSGSGKTDLVMTLLLHENGLRFENVYICAKTLDQFKYNLLKKVFDQVPEIGYYLFDNVEDIKMSELKPNSVFIFDDVITCKQNIIRDVFSFGRHNSIDVIYLVQTFTKAPKHLIRDNANVFVLFKQDLRNMRNFYNDNVTDITFNNFVDICKHCWSIKHSFISINLECGLTNGRYRQCFDKFIIL